MEKQQYYNKLQNKNSTDNKNKSCSKEEQISNLPTMNSYNNLYSLRKVGSKASSSKHYNNQSIIPLNEIKPTPHTTRNFKRPDCDPFYTNKHKKYYSNITKYGKHIFKLKMIWKQGRRKS